VTVRSASGHPPAPIDAAAFAAQVQDALARLYDLVHLQTHPLTGFVQPAPGERAAAVGRRLEEAISQAVDDLATRAGPAAAGRGHALLRARYVEALEVPEVCRRLGLSRSQFYVEHRRALDALTALLWELWAPRETVTAAPPTVPEAEAPSTNLPLQLTGFVGREREIAATREMVARSRLVTLTGTGGVGKTRLALRVAADLVGEFPDGVWLADLAPLTDEAMVPATVLAACGVRDASNREPLAALVDYLRPRELLLLLDNCEHLLDGCARLADDLLRTCPRLRILATSREMIGIAGEAASRVPSLALPDPAAAASPEELLRSEAVRLFADRARLARTDFAVTTANAALVAAVCRRLDGIPLAIELAAARVRGLTVEQIAERLDDRFRLLTGGSRTALRRQQTLRALVDWSHDLLTEPERVLLRRLAVFAGGFELEAAEAVGGLDDGGIDRAEVLDLLLQLVDRSLVVAEARGEVERYRLLETIRQYGEEKLVEAGEAEAVRDGHLRWVVDLAERAAAGYQSAAQLGWMHRLEAEHDNVRAALEWARQRGEAGAGLSIAGALFRFWEIAGHYREAHRQYASLLGMPGADAPAAAAARARVLVGAGIVAFQLGDVARAGRLLDECLALTAPAPRSATRAWALCFRGFFWRQPGNAAAERGIREALAIWTELDDGWGISNGRHMLGRVALMTGDVASARGCVAESLPRAQATGDPWLIAGQVSTLGLIAYAAGDHAEAEERLREALALWRALGSPRAIAQWAYYLGVVLLVRGDIDEARARLAESLRLLRDVGNLPTMPGVLDTFAGLAAATGRPARALRLAGAARRLRSEVGPAAMTMALADPERWLAAAREPSSGLDAAAQTAAEEEGRRMALDEAVAYALADP
jgi:non-specific serine/threonine protein kinase